MVISAMIMVIVDWAIDRVADAGVDAVRLRLRNRKARHELSGIVEKAVQAALSVVPTLQNEAVAEEFAKEIVGPALLTSICDPTIPFQSQEVAERFVLRFVELSNRDRPLASDASEVFRIDADALKDALEKFNATLRLGLYQSSSWREAIRDSALEETRNHTRAIAERLGISASPSLLSAAIAQRDVGHASQGLLNWPRTINGKAISRPEFDQLVERVRSDPNGRTLVVGAAGAGKSALLSSLAAKLIEEGMAVVAIKADLLPETVHDLRDVSDALGLAGNIEAEIDSLVRLGPVVLIVDQLDAVSEVMDRSSQRMRLMLQLANRYRAQDHKSDNAVKMHVIVSSRPFEAKHDARFRSLDADVVELALPSFEGVENLLDQLQIPHDLVPESMKETLRRPFALKLFVELVRRGEAVAELTPAQLLAAWLQSANLGDEKSRRSVLEFLERLSIDMTNTETLWRPADIYEAATPQAVRLSEACGIIVRNGSRIGFSHQAWLDDFQARRFTSGDDLAAFAHERQNGLFARATVLRGLERLRTFDKQSYVRAIDSLLGSPTTRRHLKHLVMDLIATQAVPLPREAGWVARSVREDIPLARRALPKLAGHWDEWKPFIAPLLPEIMANEELRSTAIQILASIATSEPDEVLELIEHHWGTSSDDTDTVRVLWRAALWNERVRNRVQTMFARTSFDPFVPTAYAEELSKHKNATAAAEVICFYVKSRSLADQRDAHYYGVEKIAAAAPLIFAEQLFPWLVENLRDSVDANIGLRNGYPCTHRLPFDWEMPNKEGSIFSSIRDSLFGVAKNHPHKLLSLVEPCYQVEVDEVQALIAEALLAAGEPLAPNAKDFLLGDARRLRVGHAYVDDIEGVGQTIQGWSSQELISGIVPFLSETDLGSLRDAIEAWSPYRLEALVGLDHANRLARLRWSDEARFELLERLPKSILSPRRSRQIEEWRASQPKLRTRTRGRMGLSTIGPPMSAQQMAKASDDDIMGMFNEVSDGTRRRESRSRWPLVGGASELAGAFAAFGKENPSRAISLAASRFEAGKHERAAGDLVRELSGLQSIEPQVVLSLIHTLSARGFQSEAWRDNAGWAIDAIARRICGLDEDTLALLESWIESDPDTIFQQIVRHLDHKRQTLERNKSQEKDRPQPVLFGYGGIAILPHNNFVQLSAISSGFLARKPPDYDGWLAALERHLLYPEEPAIWSAILAFRGGSLCWANRERTRTFFERLWTVCPLAFADIIVGHELWRYREMIPDAVQMRMIELWVSSPEHTSQQAAGEFIAASALVDPQDGAMAMLMSSVLESSDQAARLGCLFGAALVWRDNTGPVREAAHDVLVRYAGSAHGDEAQAIAAALDLRRSKVADACLRELLELIAKNQNLLAASLSGNFLGEIEGLLLHPSFDEEVLAIAEASTRHVLEKRGAVRVEDHLVAISIALQRSPEPIRSRAMDLYERLLDVDFYGAEEAALAALRR